MTAAYEGNDLVTAVITQVRDEAQDIRSFVFECEDAWPLPPHTAGSHIDVLTPSGQLRQYSLCSDPADPLRYRIAVLNSGVPGSGSYELHRQFTVGLKVGLSLPRNNFPLAAQAERHVLIAGGIGITPFMSMIPRLERDAARWELHYCTRSSASTAFLAYLQSPERTGRVHLYRSDERRLRMDSLLAAIETPGTHVYCCGPESMMDAFAEKTAHWPEEAVHHERFSASAPLVNEEAYRVKLAQSGSTIEVGVGETMLAALMKHGLALRSGCEVGVCGVCKVGYRTGTPTHRDHLLSSDERTRFLLPCVSVATRGDLELDL